MKTIVFIFAIITLIGCQSNHQEKEVKTDDVKTISHQPKDEFDVKEEASKIVADNPNGEYLEVYANNKIKIEGQKKDSLREGVWYSYFENGNKWSETTYKKGLKEGATLVNYPNGKPHYKGQYKNDKKSGHWIFYKEDGSIDYEENY